MKNACVRTWFAFLFFILHFGASTHSQRSGKVDNSFGKMARNFGINCVRLFFEVSYLPLEKNHDSDCRILDTTTLFKPANYVKSARTSICWLFFPAVFCISDIIFWEYSEKKLGSNFLIHTFWDMLSQIFKISFGLWVINYDLFHWSTHWFILW